VSINQLQSLVPPPVVPAHVPTAGDWDRAEAELGIVFPEELRRICAVYGAGTFRGVYTTALGVMCPGYPEFIANYQFELRRLRDIRGPHETDDHPFAVFPEDGGILPLALDENDIWICWVAKGKPEEWPLLVRWDWGLEGRRIFDMPLSNLLAALFERTIELPCFPLPTFVDDVRFVPYQDGGSIGDSLVARPLRTSTVEVVNRGEIVGRLTDFVVLDGWYLEGTFIPVRFDAAARFVSAASALDFGKTYDDHTQGVRALLRELPGEEGSLFVVMSLSEGRLFGRRLFEPAAVRWTQVHVRE
jgi:hypothetical protein